MFAITNALIQSSGNLFMCFLDHGVVMKESKKSIIAQMIKNLTNLPRKCAL
jgi:hypothetical protein